MDSDIKKLNLQFVKACLKGNVNVVEKLLENKDVDILFKDEGKISFEVISQHAPSDIIALVISKRNVPDSGIFSAIKGNKISTVKLFIQKRQRLDDLKNKETYSPLSYACAFGTVDMVKLLLTCPQDTETCGLLHKTALLIAISRCCYMGQRDLALKKAEQTQIIAALLSNGANINATDIQGWTSLHHTVNTGNVPLTELLIKYKCDLDIPSSLVVKENQFFHIPKGSTPLHIAVINSNIHMVKYLAICGANCDQYVDGNTSLTLTSNLSVIKEILNCGCDIKLPKRIENNGPVSLINPLSLSYKQGHYSKATVLIEGGADVSILLKESDETLFHDIVQKRVKSYGKISLIRALMKTGCDINMQDQYGNTSLHKEIETCNSTSRYTTSIPTLFNFLLDVSDVNKCNKLGNTPLFTLIKQRSRYREGIWMKMADKLIARGADISVRDKKGNSILHVIPSSYMLRHLLPLISSRVDINQRNSDGMTPLQCWLETPERYGYVSIINLLLHQGASIINTNIHGITLLHMLAVTSQHGLMIIEQLQKLHNDEVNKKKQRDNIDKQVPVDVALHENSLAKYYQQTPLFIAVSLGNIHMSHFLLKAGANVHVKCNKNYSSKCLIETFCDYMEKQLSNSGRHVNKLFKFLYELLTTGAHCTKTIQNKKANCIHQAEYDLYCKDFDLFRKLVRAGYKVDWEYLQSKFVQNEIDNKFFSIYQRRVQVPALEILTVRVLRSGLQPNAWVSASELNLPSIIYKQNFVSPV